MTVVYLHGFASSPQSRKAQFFGQKFRESGVAFQAPELDEGAFEKLTITGQLKVLDRTVSAIPSTSGPMVLMGSSLGGYLAALYADGNPRAVERLVLMAPAFEFVERWKERLKPEDLEQWKRQGWAPIFHYGSNSERRLGYQFLADGYKYPATPDFHQRALILHGREDRVVPSRVSYDYALNHSHTRLALFKSGHELTDVLEEMWREVATFLDLV